jgi:hypothetical protein
MKKGKAFFIIFDGSPFSYNGLEKKNSKYCFAKSSNNLTIKCFFEWVKTLHKDQSRIKSTLKNNIKKKLHQ